MNYKQIIYVSTISLLIISFIIIVFIFIPGGIHRNADSGEISIHYVSHISEAQMKVIKRFNEKYAGRIRVEAINLPFEKFSTNERKELLARYLRSKSDRIDVYTVDQIWVPRFAKWAANLDKYFNNDERNALVKNAMRTCSFEDSLVAVPLYLDVAVMFYRDDLLRRAPGYNFIKQEINNSITWADLINLQHKIYNKPEPVYLFQADGYEGLMCMFVEMMESQGKSLLENGKLQLNSAEAHNSLSMMVDLVNKYDISPGEVVNSKEKETYNMFVDKDILFLRGWPAFLNEYPRLVVRNNLLKQIQMAPTPHFKSGKPVSVFGGWNLMVSRFSPNPEEAVIFIKYLLSDEAQRIMYEEGDYIPIKESIYKTIKDKRLQFYSKLIQSGVHRPFLENYTKISDIIVLFLNKALKKEITVDQALKKASEQIKYDHIEIK